MCRRTIILILIWCFGTNLAHAQAAAERILPLDAHTAQDGRAIELNWFDAEPPRVGSVTVKRRLYGQIGGEMWQTIAPALGPVMRYRDETIRPGVAYEYQVLRTARDIVDVGYWLAGTELPAQPERGHAYVIVDEIMASAIAPRLARFEHDLLGDGWTVHRHDVPRGNSQMPVQNLKAALALKDWLQARYREDPFGQHSIILVGHVPILTSGKANPDGHDAVPHATDLFYADMDGRWSILRNGELLDNRVPGNFIEMQVGRIDLSPVSDNNTETEIQLLRAYFDKNHHWRMGYLGDLREAYGERSRLEVEMAGLRNIVGPTHITAGGHHDVGEEHPWLWGVASGDANTRKYATDYAIKAIFALNFGSHKQRIDARFNGLTALLAQQWYPLAVGWGARPAWWLHHMALGGSIGEVHRRTVNNGEMEKPYRESMDYFPTGQYLMRNPIWVNLLGDPTLRAFPLAPPQDVRAQALPEGLRLSWQASPDPDTLGYHVFRAAPGQAEFTPLTGAEPVMSGNFTDPDPVEGARYMVRAYGLKEVYAGSFYTLSQGVFSPEPGDPEIALAQNITLQGQVGKSLRLPANFTAVSGGDILAFIEGPAQGRLIHDAEGWVYTPPTGFKGAVTLRFSQSGARQTRERQLRLNIGK